MSQCCFLINNFISLLYRIYFHMQLALFWVYWIYFRVSAVAKDL